jgi:hypothetical protein
MAAARADAPDLVLLTLGQCIPVLSYQPEARGFREELAQLRACEAQLGGRQFAGRRLLLRAERAIRPWSAWTGSREAATRARCAQVPQPALGPVLQPARYRALKQDKMACHFQYLQATELPGPCDVLNWVTGPAAWQTPRRHCRGGELPGSPALRQSAAMRFALVTLGSTGDLYPFLAIGPAEQGHEVFLLTQAPYRADADRAGLQFMPVADALRMSARCPIPSSGTRWMAWGCSGVTCVCRRRGPPGRRCATCRRSALGCASAGAGLPLAVGARLARDTCRSDCGRPTCPRPRCASSTTRCSSALARAELGATAVAARRLADTRPLEAGTHGPRCACDAGHDTGRQAAGRQRLRRLDPFPDGGLALYDADFARCLGACTVCWTRRLVGRSCTRWFPLRMGAGGRSVSAEIH